MRFARHAALAAFVSGAAAFACSIVTSYDGYTPESAPAPSCGKRIPPRPVGATPGGTGSLYGLASVVQFIEEDAAAPLGFDLDGLCTCPERAACRSKTGGTTGPCDRPGTGIDNAGGGIITLLYRGQTSVDYVAQGVQRGEHGVAVRVEGWNGKPDDPDVSVALFNVARVNDGRGATFDGNDEVLAADESVFDGPGLLPRYYDTRAYVSGGILVASLEFKLRLVVVSTRADASTEVGVPLRTAYFLGRLRKRGDTGLDIADGQLVGRIGQGDLLDQVGRMGICRDDSGAYEQVKENACAALDLPLDPSSDGRDVPCESMSLAVGFAVKPAKIVGHGPTPSFPSPCAERIRDTCR